MLDNNVLDNNIIFARFLYTFTFLMIFKLVKSKIFTFGKVSFVFFQTKSVLKTDVACVP